MMSTMEHEDQMRDMDKSDQPTEIGRVARQIVHEIRNPLNAMRMQAAVIRNKLKQPDPVNIEQASQQLTCLEKEVVRLEGLASSFLELGKPPADQPQDVDVIALVEELGALIEAELEEAGIELELKSKASMRARCWVQMDRRRLCQVMHNLVSNAQSAMGSSGKLTISVDCVNQGREVKIVVADTGCGIPTEEIRRVFEPFYSRSNGNGLGLPMVKRTIDHAGGSIRVASIVDDGTEFEIRLPHADTCEACE